MEALVHSHGGSGYHREADTAKIELRNILAGQTIRHTEVLGWEVSLGRQYRRMRTVTCQPGMYHLLFELHAGPAHCMITIYSKVAASFARFSIPIPPSSKAEQNISRLIYDHEH
jgi:hypothetical protein